MGSLLWPADLEWDDSTYDTIVLGGIVMVGIATVDIKRANKIDKKTAKGQAGAKLTFQGRQPAEVSITIICWKPETFSDFQDQIAKIEPDPSKDPKPLDIVHPVAVMRGLKAIAIEELDGPKWDTKNKRWELKIKACEFAPPGPGNATSTPTSAKGDTNDVLLGTTNSETNGQQGIPLGVDTTKLPGYTPPANTGPGPNGGGGAGGGGGT